jgi:Tol biopolymer transport system component
MHLRQLPIASSSRALSALAVSLAITACDNAVAIRAPEPLVDKRLVAFVSDSGNAAGGSIFVMHADGTHKTKLTSGNFRDDHPAWSPDGSSIAFATNRSPAGIWVVNSDGSNLRPLVTSTDSMHVDEPEWSPDGRSIAFVAEVNTGALHDLIEAIMIADADGSHARQLTTNPKGEQWPSWSPDGTRIVFTASPDSTGSHIFVVNVDGTAQRQLSTGNDTDPRWSPDGSQIAFMNLTVSYYPQILVMQADGSNRHALTTKGVYRAPAWSPDGQQLEYEGFSNTPNHAPMRIYRVNADGSEARAITSDGAEPGSLSNSWSPAWKPAP